MDFAVILGRSAAEIRESRDQITLVSEMLGSSPSMTSYPNHFA
jgi:hypothetical protein